MTQLLSACRQVLAQLEEMVGAISEDDFSRPLPTLNGSTIGQHVRHTLEFFTSLESGFDKGLVNYDKRARDKRMETDKSLALATISRAGDFVQRQKQNKPLVLDVCYQRHEENFCSIQTSYYRELAYAIEHAVHHMAIIKIGIRDVAGYAELPAEFGIASSTLRYQAASAGR